jgi:hypothetical protein
MNFSKRVMFFNIVVLALAAVLWISCDTGGGPGEVDPEESQTPALYANDAEESVSATFSESANYNYPAETLNVDYNGDNNAVFFDFSTGTKTVLPHDFFDIAINGGGDIIANSGSYGSGVWVYATDEADISADFSSDEAKVKEYTFKPTLPEARLFGYQSEINPLGSLDAMATSNVKLIKVQYKTTDDAQYFKVTFGMTMAGGPPTYNVTVVPGLEEGTTNKTAIKAAIKDLTKDAGYGWLYFKLVGDTPKVLNNGTAWIAEDDGDGEIEDEGATEDEAVVVPPIAANWDILATRTNEIQEDPSNPGTFAAEMPVASRSSVLLNVYKEVQAGTVTGKLIDEILGSVTVGVRSAVDSIGYSWYSMGAGMPPTFSVAGNTYIIKTVEEKYVKFQPESFYDENNKSFVMDFSYYYQD